MKILLEVPLSTYSGYGNDGIGLTRALMRWGADVYLSPSSVQAPLPVDVAMLLTKTLVGPFDLLIQHVDPDALDMPPEKKNSAALVVGWTMWEYTNLRNSAQVDTLRERLSGFDAILCYDGVTQGAFQEFFDGPLPILQGGFWPEDWAYQERDWMGDRFGFCMVGALHGRKDPFVAIEAFRELKEEKGEAFEGAELHLKTNVLYLHPEMEKVIPKLRVHYAVWPNDLLLEFYGMQHVLLAPSRGEGKNMPALEFQSTGGVVIATDWGGHKQWLHESYAHPLDYVLRPVSDDYPTTMNARASKEHLKELMWHAYTHRNETRLMGIRASETIPGLASWDTVVENLFLRMKAALPQGEVLHQAAQLCRTS